MRKSSAAAAMWLALACGSPTFPDRPPTITGGIVGIGPEVPFGGARSVWVKDDPGDPCGIVFTATDDTEIGVRRDDDAIDPRAFGTLAVGQEVRVWSGAIAESCPGQGHADAIEILLQA